MEHLLYTFAMAALAHARKVEKTPQRRRDAAEFYLSVLADSFNRKGHYDLSAVAREVISQVRYYDSVMAVCRLYGATEAELTAKSAQPQTPASNTGVNSRQLSLIEGFVANDTSI